MAADVGEPLRRAIERVDGALDVMWAGDPSRYIDAWEPAEDVSLLGSLGPVETGWDRVRDTLGWVGAKMSAGGPSKIDHILTVEGADLAFTVDYEHRTTSLDGGEIHERVLRVTHIYRRSDAGEWRVIHRHANYAQPDPRSAP
jgi:ketosteroid isomerase-like protein